ncbi:Methyltransferase-like protein 4 [Entomortierella beljakovae]|nr:Methyltransferase-like protein 4 [Entomortierella beljakovae]
MRTTLHHNNSYLLEAIQNPIHGWNIRPGTFRVAQPYDRALSGQTLTSNVPNVDNDIQVLPTRKNIHPLPTTSRAHKKQKLSGRGPFSDANPDGILLQWIKSEYNELLVQEETQAFINSTLGNYFYGTYVDALVNETFAIDLVKLQPTLRLLKSGFISSSSLCVKNEEDESIIFDELHLNPGRNQIDLENVFETAVMNDCSSPSVLSFSTEGEPHYLIPPHSGFVVSDLDRIHGLKNIAQKGGGFDIIVMDPPWQNASVDRMDHYQTMDLYDLFKIPIPDLLRPYSYQDTTSGIVAVWITNRAKITTGGEPVLSLENTHRRAYEGILIGKQKSWSSQVSASPSEINDTPSNELQKLLVSVPAQHSRKPSLNVILEKEFFSMNHVHHLKPMPADSTKVSNSVPKIFKPLRKLELFARNLEEGVFSWGNEPIRYQYCGRHSNNKEYIQDGYFIPSNESALSSQI